jgi:hypothetical protein
MKLYAKQPSATAAMRFSIFFENAFVSLVKRRFVFKAAHYPQTPLDANEHSVYQ